VIYALLSTQPLPLLDSGELIISAPALGAVRPTAMAKLAAQLKSKFFGLVGRITSCGRAGATHKDAGNSSAAHAPLHGSLLRTSSSSLSCTILASSQLMIPPLFLQLVRQRPSHQWDPRFLDLYSNNLCYTDVVGFITTYRVSLVIFVLLN
jgi:hypothetical protein